MIPTPFFAIFAAIGIWVLVRGTMAAALSLVFVATLFGGTAVMLLPALGGASVNPALLSLTVLFLTLVRDWSQRSPDLLDAIRRNGVLLLFLFYSLVAAILLPRIFGGLIMVAPLKPLEHGGMFATSPLQFTNQNVTTAIYLVFTSLAVMLAFVGTYRGFEPTRFVGMSLRVTMLHMAFGWYDVVTRGTAAWEIIPLIRNAPYAMLVQGAGGLPRMAGILPEASAFAAYGFGWFALMFELWIRGVAPRRTGPAAAAMLLTLFASTSSTAYVSLAIYAAVIGCRIAVRGHAMRRGAVPIIAGVTMAVVCVGMAMVILAPSLSSDLSILFGKLTTEKLDSSSGLQRSFFARQGWDLFFQSWGLGVGPGSFRSSSLITAMLGSVGIIGSGSFIALLYGAFRSTVVLQPLERTSLEPALSASLFWASLMMIVPAAASGASMDPGLTWGLFVGAAQGFAMRAMMIERRRQLAV